jgi:hypothetical protein
MDNVRKLLICVIAPIGTGLFVRGCHADSALAFGVGFITLAIALALTGIWGD